MEKLDLKIWNRDMGIALILGPLIMSGCSGGTDMPAEVPYTAITGKVVSVTEECRIVIPPAGVGKGAQAAEGPKGPCNDILRTARGQEYRSAEVRRKLGVTYAYTSPADGHVYQGTSELDQSVSAPVPRPGEDLDVFAHPSEPEATRLDGDVGSNGRGGGP